MLLEACGLSKSFGRIRAVNGVSFCLESGETLGVVGESGSGKSTVAKLVALLLKPDSGEIYFQGRKMNGAGGGKLLDFRRHVQIIFQEPFASLNPRLSVADILAEPFEIHEKMPRSAAHKKAAHLLRSVELGAAYLKRLPQELSGGECQRVAIARAIALGPSLIVCDEAVSALDAIVQAQILNLLLELQRERGMAYLFISHDLKVVRHMSDRILLMKDGQALESAPRETFFKSPRTEYGRSLVNLLQSSL